MDRTDASQNQTHAPFQEPAHPIAAVDPRHRKTADLRPPAAGTTPALQLGWREWIALPQLGIHRLKCKLDTGAKSSALHATDLITFQRDGADWVRFHVHPDRRHLDVTHPCELPVHDWREVRDSSGNSSLRPFVRTLAVVGPYSVALELSLTNRDTQRYALLLGRRALRKLGASVDPATSWRAGRPQRHHPAVSG